MTEERCPFCGTKILITNRGRKFCPNCGFIDSEENYSSEKVPTYCG